MYIVFILAIIVGILHGLKQMDMAHKGSSYGVQPSNNLFTFLFTDKY
jgi:hypothetical protein